MSDSSALLSVEVFIRREFISFSFMDAPTSGYDEELYDCKC